MAGIRNILTRIRNLFDVDHNPALLPRFRGIRVPGAFDGFETAVGIILGQLVSTEAARAMMDRIVKEHGVLKPEVLRDANLHGITRGKALAIRELSQQVSSGKLLLSRTAPLSETRAQLRAIKGIGPWTEELIALRCLADPNAFPENDLVVARALQKSSMLKSKNWSPWRGYLTLWIWSKYSSGKANHVLSKLEKPSGKASSSGQRKGTVSPRLRRKLAKSKKHSPRKSRKENQRRDLANHR